jgi:hypothetical protein
MVVVGFVGQVFDLAVRAGRLVAALLAEEETQVLATNDEGLVLQDQLALGVRVR